MQGAVAAGAAGNSASWHLGGVHTAACCYGCVRLSDEFESGFSVDLLVALIKLIKHVLLSNLGKLRVFFAYNVLPFARFVCFFCIFKRLVLLWSFPPVVVVQPLLLTVVALSNHLS